MARTVVAIYDELQPANEAVRELIDHGQSRDNISLIVNNASSDYGSTGTLAEGQTVAEDTGTGAGIGTGIGAAIGGIGGLLIGLGALTIPGIGPVIAAGPLAVALSTLTGAGVGAVAGGVTGGLLGALVGLGIPEEEAEFFAEGVRRGGILVTVQATDQEADQVLNILNRHKPVNVQQRASEWRKAGWQSTSVDPSSSGHSAANASLNDPPSFQNHYHKYLSNSGYSYENYLPAYRFGYGLAQEARYQNSTWNVVVPEVQRDWEREHPGTWERYEDAIRNGWEGDQPNEQPQNKPNKRL